MWINALYSVGAEQTVRGVKQIVFDGFSDRMLFGGQLLLLGLGTVFSVLILLWGIIALLHLLVGVLPEKLKAARQNAKESAPTVEENTASEIPVPAADQAESPIADDAELVAAMAAAIAAYTGQPQSSFRVVSFKRVNKNFSVRNR